MEQSNLKTAFAADQIGKLLANLYKTGHDFQIGKTDEGRPILTMIGDLTHDVQGFDIDLVISGGDIRSAIDVSGTITMERRDSIARMATIDTTGEKIIKASKLIMPVCSEIKGNGDLSIQGDIDGSLVRINGSDLTIKCMGDMKCGKIHGARVEVDGDLTVNDDIKSFRWPRTEEVETFVRAKKLKAHGICGNEVYVFVDGDIDTDIVSSGAKIFANNKITLSYAGVPVGRGAAREGRTIVVADKVDLHVRPYNAEILAKTITGQKIDWSDRIIMGKIWPQEKQESSVMTLGTEDVEVSNKMLDLIRLAQSKLPKDEMSSQYASIINRRFSLT